MSRGLDLTGKPRSERAYVTLATNADYLTGARALFKSLIRTGTTADLVLLHTDLPADSVHDLCTLGVRPVYANLLPTSHDFNTLHGRDRVHGIAPFTRGEKPPFHTPLDNFVKLRLWQLDYARVVFLDADTLVLQNIDRLFDYPEFSAAPNVYESLADFHRLNSGVFTARPGADTFARMLSELDQPDRFWRRTDQTFLQHFFPNWHGLPVFDNMLQYVWLNLPELWRWQDIRVLHYQYEKPWQIHAKAQALRPLIDLWRAHAGDGPVPDPRDLPGPQGR